MFLITLLLWTVLYVNAESVVVQVEQGLLRGEVRRRSTGNGLFCSFKGIPYAAPPVGDLRFRAPKPALKWEGIRNATAHGPVCTQAIFDTGEYIPGSEDCLFLNIYTPTTNPCASLAVMFYIHGGGFVSGSGNEDVSGPDFLLDQNVVVVTINYRLGALGFLCLDIKEAPGNAGLKDQVAALQWVKKNIDKFGGDPNKITIIGQSAGGASVSLHVLSPMSNGLFKGAITMSGVCFSEYAVAFEPRRQGLLLAHRVGLYTENPHEAFRYLQNAPVKDIVTAKAYLFARDQVRGIVIRQPFFPPVVEKHFGERHFMLEEPEYLLLQGKTNTKEIIIGHTSGEGLSAAIARKNEIFETYPYFQELLVPTIIYRKQDQKTILELADCIQNRYFGDKEISEKNMKQFIKFYSYFFYVIEVHRYLEMWTKGGNKAYFYQFSCFSERNVNGIKALKYGVKAAGHLDDLMYLFDEKKYSNITLDKNRSSYKMIVQTCKLFTNMAKYGNPTPDRSLGTIWQYYNQNASYLNIDLNLILRRTNFTEIDFWRRIFRIVGIRFS